MIACKIILMALSCQRFELGIWDNSWRQSLFKRMNRWSRSSDYLVIPERRWYYCITRIITRMKDLLLLFLQHCRKAVPVFHSRIQLCTHTLAHAYKRKVLTLADSQHQLHGFGSAHPSIIIIQTSQRAHRGGWWCTEREREREGNNARLSSDAQFHYDFFADS